MVRFEVSAVFFFLTFYLFPFLKKNERPGNVVRPLISLIGSLHGSSGDKRLTEGLSVCLFVRLSFVSVYGQCMMEILGGMLID